MLKNKTVTFHTVILNLCINSKALLYLKMLFCELQMEFYYTSLSRNIVIKHKAILTSKIICNAEISGSWVIIWKVTV